MPRRRKIPPETVDRFSRALCAAIAGNAEAQAALGDWYASSAEAFADLGQARRWYRRAADGGVLHAQRRLAELWHEGQGGEQDDFLAAQWWQAAARGGDAESQWRLAACYAHGCGVPRNPKEALRWLERSARGGHPDAAALLAAAACKALAGASTSADVVAGLAWPGPWSETRGAASNANEPGTL